MLLVPVRALAALTVLWAVTPLMAEAPTLRIVVPQELAGLTPYSPGVPEPLLELVYDKLAAPSPYLATASPWLARSILPEGSDGQAWHIRLRENIRWHDGQTFSAEDVAFTLRYYRDGPANRWTHHASETPRLESIEVVGRLNLRIRCAHPCPDFDRVTAADLPILPAHLWRGVKQPHRYRGAIVGTGPYRVAALKPGRYLRLEANPDYFGGTPRVNRLLISFVRNPATAFAALSAGELDFAVTPVPPELRASLARQPGLALIHGKRPLNAVEIRINFERPPFTDSRFRRALALALDPAEIVQRVALGFGLAGSAGYPHPHSPWTAKDLTQLACDPASAARELDVLGFKDRDKDGWRETAEGLPLRFSLKVASSESLHLRAAQVVARQLKAVGIAVRVEAIDPGRHRALLADRQFDLMIAEIGAHGLSDPDQFVESFRSGYLWRAGTPHPKLDALLEDWQKTHTPAQRLSASFALQRFHSQAPSTLVLYYPESYQAYRPKVYDRWRHVPGQGAMHKWSLLDLRYPVPGLTAP